MAGNGTVYIANETYNENGISVYMKSVNFVGESRDNTIINGTNTGRIFTVGQAGGGQYYTFTNLTFVNGNAVGGAIWNYGTTTITNCVFKNNTGPYSGGAIYSQGQSGFYAPLTINNSYFIGNRVTSGNGGAVYGGSSNIVITNCDFINNTAVTSGSAAYGISTIHFNRIIGT